MTIVKAAQEAGEPTTTDWLGLRGANVLIAGSGGVGSACTAGFLDAGANVFVIDRSAEQLTVIDAIAADKRAQGRAATSRFDLAESGAADAAVRDAIDTLGGVDVLIHTVGVNDRRPLVEFGVDEFETMLRINLTTFFALGKAAGSHMIDNGHGRIVALSSVSGLLAHANHGPYAASKGGINQLVRVMAREWAPRGVTVNAVAPGYMETSLTKAHLSKPGVREDLELLVPVGRLGVPDEVVGPILFLASAQSRFITGHVLYVDGGRTLI